MHFKADVVEPEVFGLASRVEPGLQIRVTYSLTGAAANPSLIHSPALSSGVRGVNSAENCRDGRMGDR